MLAPATVDESLKYLQQIFKSPAALPPSSLYLEEGVILYGAGQLGVMAVEYLRAIDIPVHSVIDRAAQSDQMFMDSIPLIPLSQAQPQGDVPLLITTVSAPYSEISASLQAQGWNKILPFYDFAQIFATQHPLNNGWFSGDLRSTEHTQIENVIKTLNDPLSRAAYLQFLAWRCLREDWIFENAPINVNDRFFIPQVIELLSEQEHFVDVGSYDGRVFHQFLNICNNRFQSALLIEPDRDNYARLSHETQKLSSEVHSKVELLNMAVAETNDEKGFSHGFGFMSRLDFPKADETVTTTTIDQLSPTCTLLKLHIEGSEMNALAGAFNTLQRERPIIMATVYHNRDGLWKLPRWLMDNLTDYQFHFRLHNWCGTGAVIYAIPEERLSSRQRKT